MRILLIRLNKTTIRRCFIQSIKTTILAILELLQIISKCPQVLIFTNSTPYSFFQVQTVLYIPSLFISCICLPSSSNFPSSRTIIWSTIHNSVKHFDGLLSRRFYLLLVGNSILDFVRYFSASRDEVASSRITIGASFKIALAIEILCLSPPDSIARFRPALYYSLVAIAQ